MREGRGIQWLWRSDDAAARVLRGLLLPIEGLYAGAVASRAALYRFGVLPSYRLALPAVSIGNISVGGTGKTPVAAWVAAELRRRGARPAVILRGYGGDEPLVHSTLNPDVPVVVTADRVWGVERARVIGADIAVLDDAFQHLRARRDVDVVLVSADQWEEPRRLLPAGPWREPPGALKRASLVVVTRKAAAPEAVDRVREAVSSTAPDVPLAVLHLAPSELRSARAPNVAPLPALCGQRVLAVAAIGDPRAFVRQLEREGAIVQPLVFGDHYAFTADDAVNVALEASRYDVVVCTLKDVVKLAPHWPREAPPLWYVSLQVLVENGDAELASLLDGVIRRRSSRFESPSAPGASVPTHGH